MIETRTITREIPIPELTREHGLWALVAVAIAADLITTQIGLANGLVESNPTARGALEYGTLGFLAMKAGAVGVGLSVRPLLEREHRTIIPACLAFPWFGAAAINMYALAEIGVLA